MAVEMGLGLCGVCQSQIGEGVPIGVLSHVPFIMGHKDCVDKRKAENLMVKISKQAGPAGPIGEYVDAVQSTDLVGQQPDEPTVAERGASYAIDEPVKVPGFKNYAMPEPEPIVVEVVEPEIELTGAPQPLPGAPEYMQPQVPEQGFLPESYPALTVDLIPYTSNPMMRPDPDISIQSNGWAYIHIGCVRVAIPDREEWDKLATMMDALWNTHAARTKEDTDGSSDA